MEAHVDLAKLNDNGIKAIIDHEEDFVLVDPSNLMSGRIQLKVLESDLKLSKEILDI